MKNMSYIGKMGLDNKIVNNIAADVVVYYNVYILQIPVEMQMIMEGVKIFVYLKGTQQHADVVLVSICTRMASNVSLVSNTNINSV